MNYERQLICGLDLGKVSDHTALAVVERYRPAEPKPVVLALSPAMGAQVDVPGKMEVPGWSRLPEPRTAKQALWHYRLQIMKRWDVGTPYDAIAQWLCRAFSRAPVYDGADLDMAPSGGLSGCQLAVDKTGVGVAVVEWFQKEIRLAKSARAKFRPITITGGTAVNEDGAGYKVPKKELVSIYQVLAGTKRLKVDPRLDNCRALIKELDNFKVKQNMETGHESFEAWREQEHDDMVLALLLALWIAERGTKQFFMV